MIWSCDTKIRRKRENILHGNRKKSRNKYVETKDIYTGETRFDTVEMRFDTSNYELNRPLVKGKIKKRLN